MWNKPSNTVLIKLGSIVRHTEELLSPKGHQFDAETLKAMINDEELKEWLGEMDKLALLPIKR
ncbi:MAG: hypothetical protein PHS46_08570 [Candidatus Omnitrophica bacterium]|nr:hypothetical protein [Candidatus Omnitrophota bacterium]